MDYLGSLNKNECEIIIEKCLNTNSFEVLDCVVLAQNTNSHFSEKLLITIKIILKDKKRKYTFFGKRFRRENTDHSEYQFLKESFTYHVLLEKFKTISGYKSDFAPEFYLSTDNELIVLQNLSEKGYSTPANDLDFEHVQLVLKAIAKFHAGSIILEEIKAKVLKKDYRLTDEYSHILHDPVFGQNEQSLGYKWFQARLKTLKTLADLLPIKNQHSLKEKIGEIAKNSLEVMKQNNKLCNVICHGDLHEKQLMFRYENGTPIDCKLVDYQHLRYAPPAYDILHFIYFTTRMQDRQHHLHNWLEYYYNCLKTEVLQADVDLNTVLTFDDFEVSVHSLLPQIKLEAACHFTFQISYENLQETMKNLEGNLEQSIYKSGPIIATNMFKTDQKYRERITEALEELYSLALHEGLTMEDCFQIVKNKIGTTDYKLLDFKTISLGKMAGYLAEHYKLKININNGQGEKQKLHLFAKFMPRNKSQIDMAIDCDAYHKEIFTYKEYIPLLKKSGFDIIEELAPPCFLTRAKDVLVFEDLESLNFFVVNSKFEPFTFEQMKVVATAFAKFHACSIAYEERMNIEKQTKTQFRLCDQFKRELQETFFLQDENNKIGAFTMTGLKGILHLIEIFPEESGNMSQDEFKAKALKASELLYTLITPSEEFRNVFAHGDVWFNNVLLKHENGKPVDCRLIDFQIYRYCPPAHDLLVFIYTSSDRVTRKKHLKEALDYYHSELAKFLQLYNCDINECLPYEEFVKSCKYMWPQAICHSGCHTPLSMVDSNMLKEYIKDEERGRRMFSVDRSDFIDEMCAKDPIYKEKLREYVCDLRDMCEQCF